MPPNEPDENFEPIDPLDRAFTEYLRRSDSGEPLSRESFLASLPREIAGGLKELIEAADHIGQFTGVLPDTMRTDAVRGQGSPQISATNSAQRPRTSITKGPAPNRSGQSYGADTIAQSWDQVDGSGGDMAVTLPIAHRAKGDHGPTLPFDLGDYELLEIIGLGGMGVVYRAYQKELDRDVAVKMIRSGILASEAEVKRFYTEAQAAARLHHPGIVSVFQFGRRADHHFFSMEMIKGDDLQRLINRGTLEARDAARYVRDVARAIHYAHQSGVLHRDLKPANILVDQHDRVHVTDFGLAKHLDSDSSVTGSGDAVGTPHYMAPEQAGGFSDRACRRSDVYSLGAVLFACLTGRPPIVADTVMQTLVKVVHDPAPPVRSIRADAPIDLETICAKCLEKNPVRRYQSAAELADELDAFLAGLPIQARPRWAPVKAAQWFTGVPLFGALTGRKILTSTQSHRRFQAAMLCLFLLAPLIAASAMVYVRQTRDAMPRHVAIAGGIDGGLYNELSQNIAQQLAAVSQVQTTVIPSGGSLDNRELLLSGKVQLAPMQTTAVSGDEIRVAAPLFYEIVYAMAKNDSGIKSINDLEGRRVEIGPPASGSSATAELIFASIDVDPAKIQRIQSDWSILSTNDAPDAAILCLGRGSDLVDQLLQSGRWSILEIPTAVDIALAHPTLRPMQIHPSDHPGIDMPVGGITTVGTTGFLAVRTDAPADLVTTTLRVLYQYPPTAELIPRRQAAEWQGLAFHPAARAFYSETPK